MTANECIRFLEEYRDELDPDKCHYVYFISDGTNIKIGYTTKPAKLVSNLQAANSAPLRVLAVFQAPRTIEGFLHFAFRHNHVTGEWFEDCEPVRTFLAEIDHLIGYRDEE